jgi:hypothetical protein
MRFKMRMNIVVRMSWISLGREDDNRNDFGHHGEDEDADDQGKDG